MVVVSVKSTDLPGARVGREDPVLRLAPGSPEPESPLAPPGDWEARVPCAPPFLGGLEYHVPPAAATV